MESAFSKNAPLNCELWPASKNPGVEGCRVVIAVGSVTRICRHTPAKLPRAEEVLGRRPGVGEDNPISTAERLHEKSCLTIRANKGQAYLKKRCGSARDCFRFSNQLFSCLQFSTKGFCKRLPSKRRNLHITFVTRITCRPNYCRYTGEHFSIIDCKSIPFFEEPEEHHFSRSAHGHRTDRCSRND